MQAAAAVKCAFQRRHRRLSCLDIVAVCSTSTKATRKAFRAFVKAALASYEVTQGFIQVLEFHRVPQQPRPFAPRPTIDLVGISRAKNHSGERFRSGSLTDCALAGAKPDGPD